MKRNNATKYPENSLQDENLKKLFDGMHSGKTNDEHDRFNGIMQRIRAAETRRAQRNKFIIFALMSVLIVCALILTAWVFYHFFISKPEFIQSIKPNFIGIFIPMVFFFYLMLELWLSHRFRSRKK